MSLSLSIVLSFSVSMCRYWCGCGAVSLMCLGACLRGYEVTICVSPPLSLSLWVVIVARRHKEK